MTAYELGSDPSAVVALTELAVAFPHVQRFADGAFLVVGSRCHWRPDGPELNAQIVAEDGRIERSGSLGDGLEHVQIDSEGTIWAGYFDEGIFGNYGWGAPDGPRPLGASGIVAWSRTFDKVWEVDEAGGLIRDCYALNAGEGSVWACPYTDFPVLAISDGDVHIWQTDNVAGPRGIVANADRVALIGAHEDPSLLISGHLDDRRFVEDQRTHLRGADGAALGQFDLHCSGSVAHLFAGNMWSTFDLDDIG